MSRRSWSMPRADRPRSRGMVSRAPVAGDGVEVAGARVLGQITDGRRPLHEAGGSRALPREHATQGRLARAVASDEADPVTGTYPERRGFDQQPRTGAQL